MTSREIMIFGLAFAFFLAIWGASVSYYKWEDETRYERHKKYIETIHSKKANELHPSLFREK